jgi:hypothetical protein
LFQGYIANHIEPALGTRKAPSLRRADVERLHKSIGKAKPVTANRVLALIGATYSFGMRSGRLPERMTNPASGIEKFREQVRERFLSEPELYRLGEAIREAETVGIPWIKESKSKHARKVENRITNIGPHAAGPDRLPFRVELAIKRSWPEQTHRRSRVHLSFQINQKRRRWRNTMKKFLMGTAGLIALGVAAPASAADLAARPYTKAPPPMVAAIYDWSGFYIGANGGWGSSHKCWDITNFPGATIVPTFPSKSGALTEQRYKYLYLFSCRNDQRVIVGFPLSCRFQNTLGKICLRRRG